MTQKKLQELKQFSKMKPIATQEETNELILKLKQVQHGSSYALIIGPDHEEYGRVMMPDYAQNLHDMTLKTAQIIMREAKNQNRSLHIPEVVTLTNGLVPSFSEIEGSSSFSEFTAYATGRITLSDLRISSNKQKLYIAPNLSFQSQDHYKKFEEAVTHDGYNYAGHLRIISSDQAMLINSKNPTATILDYQQDLADLKEIINENKPDMLIFKMSTHSKERIDSCLSYIQSLDEKPLLCCEPDVEGGILNAEKPLMDFIFSCHEYGLKPAGFKIVVDEQHLKTEMFQKNDLQILAKRIGTCLAESVTVNPA